MKKLRLSYEFEVSEEVFNEYMEKKQMLVDSLIEISDGKVSNISLEEVK